MSAARTWGGSVPPSLSGCALGLPGVGAGCAPMSVHPSIHPPWKYHYPAKTTSLRLM